MLSIILNVFFVLLVLIIIVWELDLLVNGKAPFVSTPARVFNRVFEEFGIKDTSVIYDLGCGDARILLYLYGKNPNAKYIGVENSPIAFLLAKIRTFLSQAMHKIYVVKGDFFKMDLHEATHIYMWLSPEVMNDLFPKLERELKPGTRLIACDFSFSAKMPAKVIDLNGHSKNFGHTLYVYNF